MFLSIVLYDAAGACELDSSLKPKFIGSTKSHFTVESVQQASAPETFVTRTCPTAPDPRKNFRLALPTETANNCLYASPAIFDSSALFPNFV